mmetsp:Transcript_597/g.1561  ORF Transcript_597/g.1561 Transcript_597/m.1561 type:complete len:332 (-) Transcript_597:366-1361(-)
MSVPAPTPIEMVSTASSPVATIEKVERADMPKRRTTIPTTQAKTNPSAMSHGQPSLDTSDGTCRARSNPNDAPRSAAADAIMIEMSLAIGAYAPGIAAGGSIQLCWWDRLGGSAPVRLAGCEHSTSVCETTLWMNAAIANPAGIAMATPVDRAPTALPIVAPRAEASMLPIAVPAPRPTIRAGPMSDSMSALCQPSRGSSSIGRRDHATSEPAGREAAERAPCPFRAEAPPASSGGWGGFPLYVLVHQICSRSVAAIVDARASRHAPVPRTITRRWCSEITAMIRLSMSTEMRKVKPKNSAMSIAFPSKLSTSSSPSTMDHAWSSTLCMFE